MLIDKLIEQIKYSPDDYEPITDFCDINILPEAKCFHITWNTFTEMCKLLDGKFEAKERIRLARIPYPLCFIEIENAPNSEIMRNGIIIHALDNGWICKSIGINKRGFIFDDFHQGTTYDADIRYGNGEPDYCLTEEEAEICIETLDVAVNILYMINCPSLVETITSDLTQLNKARIKKNKVPLKEYTTITLNLTKEERLSLRGEGAHNSPRCHMRRGHFRNLSDKVIWVRHCIVGKGDKIKQNYQVIS